MLSSVRRHLTVANVLAAIAVFAALGGGIAWALKANSVKSRHIKNGEVKFQDLNATATSFGFTYTASTGDVIQEEVLDVGGYRVLVACENNSGQPSIHMFLDLPQDGRLVGHGTTSTSPSTHNPSAGPGLDVEGDTAFDAGSLPAPAGESRSLGSTFTFIGQTRAATINIHLLADDDSDTCRLNGMLIPGVMAPS
jgi:hypothetical protein